MYGYFELDSTTTPSPTRAASGSIFIAVLTVGIAIFASSSARAVEHVEAIAIVASESQACDAPTCATPPKGCSYQEASACECGNLVCTNESYNLSPFSSVSTPTALTLTTEVTGGGADYSQTVALIFILSVTVGLLIVTYSGGGLVMNRNVRGTSPGNRRHPTFHD